MQVHDGLQVEVQSIVTEMGPVPEALEELALTATEASTAEMHVNSAEAIEERCREERSKAIAAFTRMTELLAIQPSESHARHLVKLSDKLSKIRTTGQAMEALIGMTSSASRTSRCGGRQTVVLVL